jgi:hypothetical protein
MKRILILCPFLLFYGFLQAQLPEDALRMSYARPYGSAREQAIGGAMGSLGGDITANYVNPAGLGFYKTGEVVFSPGWSFGNVQTGYLSNNTKSPSFNNFIIGTSGVVYGWSDSYDPRKSTAISLAVTRSADFNGHITYQGKIIILPRQKRMPKSSMHPVSPSMTLFRIPAYPMVPGWHCIHILLTHPRVVSDLQSFNQAMCSRRMASLASLPISLLLEV